MTDIPNTKLIPLTQGKYAIVDEMDYEWLSQWKWNYHKFGYAIRTQHICITDNKQIKVGIRMHRLIMDAADGLDVDHINGDTIDNRRSNLRVCSRSENMMNQRKTRGTSKYKGVYWNAERKKWMARLKIDKKTIFLGRFLSQEDAALAYNNAATQYFGEFARLNEEDYDD